MSSRIISLKPRIAFIGVRSSWLTLAKKSDLRVGSTKALFLEEAPRSEEHTSELQSLSRISYAVFGSTRNGIVKEKVDPWPSSLSPQMRPPCSSTNFFVMLNPRPVPPNSRAIVASL